MEFVKTINLPNGFVVFDDVKIMKYYLGFLRTYNQQNEHLCTGFYHGSKEHGTDKKVLEDVVEWVNAR